MALDSTVKVKFLGDAAQLARESLRAAKATDQVGKSAENAHKNLVNMAKGLAVGAGIGAAGYAIKRFASSSVNAFKDAAAEASKLSRLTGLAAEDASRLGFAAHETGQDADNFAKALGLLSKNLVAADKAQTVLVKTHHLAIQQVPKLVDGHLKYVAVLKNVEDVQKKTVPGAQSLGFALRDAEGNLRPLNELLPEIADKFKNMADGPEKTALALKLFGRSGAELLPFLNKGAEGLAGLGREADKLGITMSVKDVAAYRAYVRAQREFHAAMNGVKITLGRELFPLFTAWSRAVAENAPQINATAREYVGKLVPAIQSLAGWVEQLITGFRDSSGAGGELRDALSTTADVAKTFGDVLLPIVKFLAEHPHVFEALVAGLVAFKVAALAATFRASALGVALFGVASGEAAATAAAAPAVAAMTGFAAIGEAAAAGIVGIGAAAAGIVGTVTAAALAVGGLWAAAVKLADFGQGDPHAPSNFDTNDPNLSPYAQGGGMRMGDGTFIPDNKIARKTPVPYNPDEDTELRVRKGDKDRKAHDAARQQANSAAAAQATADKANQSALDAQLKQATAAQAAADAKQKAADALQKASDAMKQALTDRLETARSIRDSLINSNSVVRDGLSWTARDLLSRFRTQMDKVRRFSAAIQEMVRKGYSPDIVAQVAQAGVQGGLGTAVGLAHASSLQVRQFNAVQGSIDKYAAGAGGAVAGQMGPIQITTKVMLDDKVLATAVNNWNREHAAAGHR